MNDYTETNLEMFADQFVNARIGSTVEALKILTPVEFRMWITNCQTYQNFHPSHFQGLEDAFLKTGKWELPKINIESKEDSK